MKQKQNRKLPRKLITVASFDAQVYTSRAQVRGEILKEDNNTQQVALALTWLISVVSILLFQKKSSFPLKTTGNGTGAHTHTHTQVAQ